MSLPDMNPIAAKLMGGTDYRRQLRQQLLAQADETDDPAYAERLRAVADGRRPLRTLMADPAFLERRGMRRPADMAQMEQAMDQAREPNLSPAEYAARLKEELLRHGFEIPTAAEASANFPEVERLIARAREVIREEEASGWGGTTERLAEQDAREAEQAKRREREQPPNA